MLGSVFVVGVPQLAIEGGRFTAIVGELSPTTILELGPDGLRALGKVTHIDAALDAMVAHVAELATHGPLRIGVGDADRPTLSKLLVDRLRSTTQIEEITCYEVGPSVAAHTGAGSIGVVYCSLDLDAP